MLPRAAWVLQTLSSQEAPISSKSGSSVQRLLDEVHALGDRDREDTALAGVKGAPPLRVVLLEGGQRDVTTLGRLAAGVPFTSSVVSATACQTASYRAVCPRGTKVHGKRIAGV